MDTSCHVRCPSLSHLTTRFYPEDKDLPCHPCQGMQMSQTLQDISNGTRCLCVGSYRYGIDIYIRGRCLASR